LVLIDFYSSTTSSSTPSDKKEQTPQQLTLTKLSGHAAFQLYSRPISAMNEVSIVDGLIKLYDGMTHKEARTCKDMVASKE